MVPGSHVERHIGDADKVAVVHFQMLDAQAVDRRSCPSCAIAVAAAEIGLDHGFVLDHVGRRALRDHMALIEDDHALPPAS